MGVEMVNFAIVCYETHFNKMLHQNKVKCINKFKYNNTDAIDI